MSDQASSTTLPGGGDFGSALRRGVSKAFVLRVCGFGFLSLMHFVLARFLGPAGYGTFSFMIAVVGLAAVLAPLGWPVILQRYVAHYTAQAKWGELTGVLLRSLQVTLAAAAAAALATFLATRLLPLSHSQVVALRFGALLIPVVALVKLRRNALQGLHDVAGMLVPEEILLPALVLAGTLALGLHDLPRVLTLYLAAAGVSFVVGTLWLYRRLPAGSRDTAPVYHTRNWMSAALPMLGSDVSKYAMNRTDVLLLGMMVQIDAVGLYSAANRLALMVPFFMAAVNAAAAPLLASAQAAGRPDQFRLVLRRAILWSTAGAFPVFVLLVAAPSLPLGLFGAGYASGATLLRILALGQLVNAVSGPVGFALIMSGRERIFAVLVASTALLNVAGNLVAIPRWGATGAAAVTAVTVAMLNAGSFVALRRAMAVQQ